MKELYLQLDEFFNILEYNEIHSLEIKTIELNLYLLVSKLIYDLYTYLKKQIKSYYCIGGVE